MGIRPNASQGKVILALKRCIVDTFDDSKWRELAYLTGSQELIESHPRLLRSPHYVDEDYDANAMEIIPQLIDGDDERLRIVEDYVGLDEWLQHSDPALHEQIYEAGNVFALNHAEELALRMDVLEVSKHIDRIRSGIQSDPELAIGSAKELLESVLKAIVGLEGQKPGSDMHSLLKDALRTLDLDTQQKNLAGDETIRRTLSNLVQIVVGVAEVRNLYGTGHGRYKSRELEIAHVRLIVNAAATVATFLIEMANEIQSHDALPW